jgi:hypothetical protein
LTQTVSDSATNSYSAALNAVSDADNNNLVTHWIAQDCIAATPTVTVAWGGGSTPYLGIFLAEITGVQNVAKDGSNGNHQVGVTGTDAVVSGAATNTATAFMLGLCSQDGPTAATPVAGTGFTNAGTGSPGWTMGGATNLMRAEYKASVAAASNQATFTTAVGAFDCNTVMVMLKEASSGSYEQEGYRWRNDDGSETAATWKASQDTNSTTAVNNNVRVRVLINRTG